MYGRIGNHPSLDKFKENNGFIKFSLKRFYVAVSGKGRIALRLGLHRQLKDMLPQRTKSILIPIYNWVSRNKTRAKIHWLPISWKRRSLQKRWSPSEIRFNINTNIMQWTLQGCNGGKKRDTASVYGLYHICCQNNQHRHRIDLPVHGGAFNFEARLRYFLQSQWHTGIFHATGGSCAFLGHAVRGPRKSRRHQNRFGNKFDIFNY